jgi:hypothetical protein
MHRYSFGLLAIVLLICLSFSGVFAKGHDVKASYLKLPLSFIKNEGQKNPSILYYEQSSGHVTTFTKEGISFALAKPAKGRDSKQISEVVTLTPLNASPFTIEAIDKREGMINYLIGNDQKKWKTNIPTYGAILYKGVYPGVDMKFYGTDSQLEYDIIVSPQTDPSKIHLSYKGIEKFSLTPTGDLDISLKEGSLLQKKPYIYQTINGARKEIEGRFVIAGTTYGFEIGPYDKNHPLIIDPVLAYSTYLGGSGGDGTGAIAVDSSGNAYVAGSTDSTNFPTKDPYQSHRAQKNDIFVTKLNPSGNALVYSTYLGGSGDDWATGIAVDSSGNAYMAGLTDSTNFPTLIPCQGYNAGGLNDIFVTKLNPSGNALVYSTYLGGSGDDWVIGIAVDSSGNAHVAGHTDSTNFPTKDPYQGSYGGGEYDAVVIKLTHKWIILTVQKTGVGSGLVTSEPSGVDCGSDCTDVYVEGETITLTANAEPDSIFRGWLGGGCSGNDICVLTLTADVTITATFVLRPQLSINKGTVGAQITIIGSGLGSKKGKVLIGGVATKIAKDGWTPDSITCTVTKVPLPAETAYDVMIMSKEIGSITLPSAFTVKLPEPQIDPGDNDHGASGDPITINGDFFGTKKGKVYLEYEKDGKPMKKNCKVTSWGMNGITFIVPKTSKSFPAGTYPLKVMNKVGIAEAPSNFTID